MKTAPMLRCVDESAPEKVGARLVAQGYQPTVTELLADTLYFQFVADFADGAQLTGYIDRIAWMNHALPQLAGIDWFSVEENILSALVSTTPWMLSLHDQHADLHAARIVAWQRDTSQIVGLPMLTGAAGKVSIIDFRCGPASRKLTVETAQKLTLPLVFLLGFSHLRLKTLALVKVGDVLLIHRETKWVQTHQKTLYSFELNQEAIMIQAAEDESAELFQEAPAPGELNSLPIELSFILYEKTLTLGELTTLGPGEVLPLPQNTLLDVEIRANRRCFARGELIQLSDGRLGVEIRKIWP